MALAPTGQLVGCSKDHTSCQIGLWDVLSKNQQRICTWSAREPPPPGNNRFAFWTVTYHSHFFRVTLNPGFSVRHARRLAISTRALLTSQTSPSGCLLAWARLGLNIEPTISAKCFRSRANIGSTSTTEQAYHRFKGLLVCNRPHKSRQPASDPLWAPCLVIRHFANEGVPISGSLD